MQTPSGTYTLLQIATDADYPDNAEHLILLFTRPGEDGTTCWMKGMVNIDALCHAIEHEGKARVLDVGDGRLVDVDRLLGLD